MYSIGEISKIVKISVDALRYYDEIGLLKPYRIEDINRYRYYSEEQVKDILLIMELKQYGFSLDAIKELFNCNDSHRLKVAFDTKLHKLLKEKETIEKSISLIKRRINNLESESEDIMNNKTILHIDDSAFMRLMIKDALGKHGYTSTEASNGSDGVKKYFEIKPDLVLMDIGMADLDGVATTKMIMEKDPTAKIVMLSAQSFIATILKSLQAGACDFKVKPFRMETILDAISKNLNENIPYNSNIIEDLLSKEEVTSQPQSVLDQHAVNRLLSICMSTDLENNFDVVKFLNS